MSEGLRPPEREGERRANSSATRAQPGPTRCAICHDGLAEDAAERWACEGCGTFAHPECASELSRCPTLGCAGELPTGERALRYHEMLERRDGWLLRWVPLGGALAGAVLGAILAWLAPPWAPRSLVKWAVLGAMSMGLVATVVGFVGWEALRRLGDAKEPWDE